MPIPNLDPDGFLPTGMYDCSLEEIRERFGQFTRSNKRIELFDRLLAYVSDLRLTGMAVAIVVDGSFVTGKAEPDDVDLVVVLAPDHDFTAEIRPYAYNVLSRRQARRLFRFDILVAREGASEYDEYCDFFMQVKGVPGKIKGLLRVTL